MSNPTDTFDGNMHKRKVEILDIKRSDEFQRILDQNALEQLLQEEEFKLRIRKIYSKINYIKINLNFIKP